MTVLELIDSALRLIEVVDAGETPSSTERDDAFETLNTLIESWNAEPNAIAKQTKQSYSGASWTIARPIAILSASCTAVGVTMPVEVCTAARWAEAVIERSVVAIFSKALFCDYAFPTSTVTVAPLNAGTVELVMLVPAFTAFGATADTVTLPPGYLKALRYGLALELAPEYGTPADVVASVAAIAAEAKAAIGSTNLAARGVPTGAVPEK